MLTFNDIKGDLEWIKTIFLEATKDIKEEKYERTSFGGTFSHDINTINQGFKPVEEFDNEGDIWPYIILIRNILREFKYDKKTAEIIVGKLKKIIDYIVFNLNFEIEKRNNKEEMFIEIKNKFAKEIFLDFNDAWDNKGEILTKAA